MINDKTQKAALVLSDLLSFVLAVPAALWLRSLGEGFNMDSLLLHLAYFLPLTFIFLLTFLAFGLYEREVFVFKNKLLPKLLLAQVVNFLLAVLAFFLLPLITPKLLLVIYFVIATALVAGFRVYVWPLIFTKNKVGALVLGTSIELSELAEKIDEDKYFPIEIKAIAHPELLSSDELKRLISKLIDIDSIQIIILDIDNHALDPVLNYLYRLAYVQKRVKLYDARELYEEVFGRVPVELVDSRWVFFNIRSAANRVFYWFKWVVDKLAGVVLGILFFLFLPFVYIAHKLWGEGSLFYVSKRVGYKGKSINILKFSTMTGNDDSESAKESKLQVTPLGRILRRTRIDELPQFVNLLRGEISFVGPRPEIDALSKEYKKHIPFYHLRESVKPGLTGWAQVKQDSHPHHQLDIQATKQKIEYDLFYLKRRSPWFDAKVILLTVYRVLFDNSHKNISNSRAQ